MSHNNNKNRYNEYFSNNIKYLIDSLKECKTQTEAYSKSIELNDGGLLLPISSFLVTDETLISELSLWREENSYAYPSIFTVTHEGTRKWLINNVLNNNDKILFLILDKYGRRVGHIGLSNCETENGEIEIDNVLKGNKQAQRGIMTQALNAIIEWLRVILAVKKVYLKVISDNSKAIEFYLKNGFKEAGKIPLVKIVSADRTDWVEAKSDEEIIDKYFIVMEYKSNFTVKKDKVILTAGPSVSCQEMYYASDAAKNGWNNEWGKYIKRFEKRFADYIGVKYALSTSSCTGALHLSLIALGIGPGDEVIVPDLTWVASAQVINYVGATAIFADIDEQSWTLDPESFKHKITKKTKAVIPVHTYGHPAEMDRIMAIAKENNLYVIEDAAPSIGAEFKGIKTGCFGDVGCFSFQGAKLVVCGEGGMMVTNNDELYNKYYKIWDQGRKPGTFWIDEIGWKYKMSNIQAAFGLGQLERVDMLIEAKRQIFKWYQEGLNDCPFIKLNHEKEWARSIYWMSSILLTDDAPIKRDEMILKLKEFNIDSRPVFPAISKYSFWPKKQTPNPIANKIGQNAINLPSGVCLRKEEVEYICSSIRNILKQ